MARKAQFTPEEIRQRRNARRVRYQREMMQDPEYKAKQQAMWRSWYARKGKEKVLVSVRKWRAENPHRAMFADRKTRAKERGLEWTLEFEDFTWPTHCPALGIELDYGRKIGRHPHDNSPSLDRLDNTRGYVKGNVLVVSQLANRIKSSSTPAQLAAVAAFYAGLSTVASTPADDTFLPTYSAG